MDQTGGMNEGRGRVFLDGRERWQSSIQNLELPRDRSNRPACSKAIAICVKLILCRYSFPMKHNWMHWVVLLSD